MKRVSIIVVLMIAASTMALLGFRPAATAEPNASRSVDTELSASLKPGKATPRSMSVLTFAPDGTLFIGDSLGGAVFAIATDDEKASEPKPAGLPNIEDAIAARLGGKASDVMIHDLAVHPLSGSVYLATSMGRAGWNSIWQLPNHIADADILLRVDPDGTIHEVVLDKVRFARIALPNPVSAEKKHPFLEDLSLRTDTITDMAMSNDILFVAGLSNEEFASALWKVPIPFADGTTATTVEIYHGAHGAYETQAPIRTFVPYTLGKEEQILAAYLCTPLSLFKVKDLEDKTHLKGRTVAEFGAGNYPLDMVVVKRPQGDQIIIANSNLPLIILDTEDIANFDGEIIEHPSEYTAGVKHIKRSGTGIQQLDVLANKYLVTLQRMPNGNLDLSSRALRRG